MQWGAISVGVTSGVNTEPLCDTTFTRRAWVATGSVVAAAVLFGSTGTTRALGPDEATTLGVGAVRLALGAVVLALGVAVAGRPWGALRPLAVAVGGLAVAGYQVTFFTGTQRTGVAVGTVTALATGPVVAGLLEVVRRRRLPSPTWIGATVLAIVGVSLIVGASGGVEFDPVGTSAAVAAGACYAVYATTVGWQISQGADPLAAMAATFLTGGVVIAPLLFTEPVGWVMSGSGLAVTLHLGVATVAVAYALYAVGLSRLSVPTAVTLTLAEPVTATVLGRFVLHEDVPVQAWVGIGLVIVGLLAVGRSVADQ